jgi:crossover junction endodeoxyribonuclease RusA
VAEMVTFEIPGRPVPKARPRMTKSGHVYTPEPTTRHEEDVAWMAKDAGVQLVKGKRYNIEVDFHVSSLRGDVDNLAKLLLDGLQRGYPDWNDSQVYRLVATKVKDGALKTVVRIEALE